MKMLAIKCLREEVEFDHDMSDGTTVQSVSTDKFKVEFWNSSNSSAMCDIETAMMEISNALLLGEMSGSFSCPYSWGEIMWEVKEIN